MSIKINETNPIHPLLSAVTAVAEEVGVKAKALICQDTIAAAEPAEANNDCPPVLVGINYVISIVAFLWKAGEDLFNGLVNYIMNTFVCLTGGKPNYQNVDLDALTATHNYKVNRERISEVPVDISIPVQDLKIIYKLKLDSILGVYDALPADQKLPGIRAKIQGYVAYIQNGLAEVEKNQIEIAEKVANNQETPKVHPKAFEYQEMERMMMHIALHLGGQAKADGQKGEIPPAKICEAFTKLSDAWDGCGPHKYKGLKRAYEKIIVSSLDEKFLFWLKDFKRELILTRYQGEQMHVENHAAHQLVDWGIGPDKAEANDPYEMMGGCGLSGLNYRYTLNQECTPARIVQVLKTSLDMEDPVDTVNPFLQALAEKHPEVIPDNLYDEILDAAGKGTGTYYYWEKDKELSKPNHDVLRPNYKLVAFLAHQTGFLTPSLTIL